MKYHRTGQPQVSTEHLLVGWLFRIGCWIRIGAGRCLYGCRDELRVSMVAVPGAGKWAHPAVTAMLGWHHLKM